MCHKSTKTRRKDFGKLALLFLLFPGFWDNSDADIGIAALVGRKLDAVTCQIPAGVRVRAFAVGAMAGGQDMLPRRLGVEY